MYTKQFWADAVERAVATAAQAALTLLSLDGVGIVNSGSDLETILAAAGFGALFSLLKSLVASGVGKHESASLLPGVTTYETK